MSASLSAARRARDLQALAGGDIVDLLVVGGGITGVGVALDAASRGLSTALLERHDLAYGTSRWSSKLVHGGLRYLASGQLGVAYESARERARLLTAIAPHLVRPLPFLVPIGPAHSRREARLTRVGIGVGELLRAGAGTSPAVLPRGRRIPVERARELFPALGAARAALQYWDGQLVDDARLVVAVARTAAAFGARIVTRAEVVGIDGERVSVRDTLTGEGGTLRARTVVVAAGVLTGQLAGSVQLRPSRGSHLVVRAEVFGNPSAAVNLLVPGSRNRWVFVLPQPDRLLSAVPTALVGLTDDPVEELTEVPRPGPQDEAYLLSQVSAALGAPVRGDAVLGSFAGLRPLVAGRPAATADLSRRHELRSDPDTGAFALVGGKLTTYRAMAEQAVDAVVGRLGRGGPSRTARLPLVGAADPARIAAVPAPARLRRRYGLEAAELARLGERRPQLLEPVADGLAVRKVEFLWAARHEGALDVEDLVARRTRLSLVGADRPAAQAAAEALAEASEESARYRR